MAEPELVTSCVAAMRAAVDVPVTVKHRIAIDDQPEWEPLVGFVDTVAAAGCANFVAHVPKDWLHGLSPRGTREEAPLHYARGARRQRAQADEETAGYECV